MAYLQQSEVNGLRLGRGYGGYVNSTAFGRCALNSTNSYSTGIGYKVGQCDTVRSTFIGALAGQYVTGSFGYSFGNKG
jgi:hypothetical protein